MANLASSLVYYEGDFDLWDRLQEQIDADELKAKHQRNPFHKDAHQEGVGCAGQHVDKPEPLPAGVYFGKDGTLKHEDDQPMRTR